MNFEDVIKSRISTRSFKNDKITREELEKILNAGRLAPTAKNNQPQKIYVVESREGLEKIDRISRCRYNAPTVLMICADKTQAWQKEDYSSYEMDTSIVATHMMLEATNIGVDNIWIMLFDKEMLKKEFNLPSNIEPVCLMPLGYRSDDYKASPLHYNRKSLDETIEYI